MSGDVHVFELLPAYALGCLDLEEIDIVRRHLEVCAVCRIELEGYRETTDSLALAAPDALPSPDLKRRLMDRIEPPAAPPVSSAGPKTSWRQSLAGWLGRTGPAWSAVALVLILALAVSNLWLWQRLRELEAVTRPVELQTVALQGTETAPEATGLIVISMDGIHGTVVVDRLPPLAPDQEYQLWLIKDGRRDSGGVFSVGEDGYGAKWVGAPEPLASYSSFGISIEPAGGSPAPTGPRVLGGALN